MATARFASEVKRMKKKSGDFLAADVQWIIVETDEENPTTIARIEEGPEGAFYPEAGYRVRVKFRDED
ncbi:hypothetical protein ACLGL1_08235 [Peptococcus simiae]|uniref:hypothetical protein n=1 Tax=Peptococcus simiae TaxID=1643805 RepID=UPI00397F3BBE